jgi:hypothetical protein
VLPLSRSATSPVRACARGDYLLGAISQIQTGPHKEYALRSNRSREGEKPWLVAPRKSPKTP